MPVAKASQRDTRQEKLVAAQEDAARTLSQQLPMRVDNSLILVGVRSEGIRLHYKYRFDVPMDRERFEQVKPKIFAGLITKNCIAKIQRQMLRNGASYRFSYVDTSDGYLGGLTLRDQNLQLNSEHKKCEFH